MKRLLLIACLLGCAKTPAPAEAPAAESVSPKEIAFWQWFVSHLGEPIIPIEIGQRLSDVDPAITYYLNGRTLFLAGGSAKRLASAAPPIPGWHIAGK